MVTSTSEAGGTTTTSDPTPVLEVGAASAVDLTSQAECVGAPPAPIVAMAWRPSGAGAQRVDVTVTADGFDTGNFLSSDPLDPSKGTLEWHAAEGEAVHRWRVLTRTDGGWTPSATATFEGPGCVGADFQD